jgi:hypothetical protein
MAGERLDLESSPHPDDDGEPSPEGPKRFIGVHFACCAVYARAYLNAAGTAYHASCPRCGWPVTFEIGPGGSNARFYTAS